jgi:hypothetical protein
MLLLLSVLSSKLSLLPWRLSLLLLLVGLPWFCLVRLLVAARLKCWASIGLATGSNF